jgi:pyridoxamine 5'-phosphate oxidase
MQPIDRTEEPFPDHYDDLAASLDFAWQLVCRAARDRKSAFHAPVLASSSPAGAQARVMVLRAADAIARSLTFHTDTRSSKAAELAHDPRVSVIFYDAPRKLQLRLSGLATLHSNDAFGDSRWSSSALTSLRAYLGDTPGAVVESASSGLPEHLQGRAPTAAEAALGRANFAALQVDVQRVEYLYLHSRGQRRAQFEWQGDSPNPAWQMAWLNP